MAGHLASCKDYQSANNSRSADCWNRDIAAVRYAPSGWYMKDHCFVLKNKKVHLFAPLGKVGTSWEDAGSEETAEHMVSGDLVKWKHLGTAVAASNREGYFDKMMGGIAPEIIEHNGKYYMFYSGWTFHSKRPNFDFKDYCQSIGFAVSNDLDHWEKPEEFAKEGLGVSGTDPSVVRDEVKNRWLMYTATNDILVFQSNDLFHWSQVGIALSEKDLKGGTCSGNQAESPFVMKHPISGKWIIFLNGGYSVSDDPFRFPQIHPYSFKSGWRVPDGIKNSGNWGDGTNCKADDDGVGFAHEVLKFKDRWYMSGVVGKDGRFKLKFTPIEWTADSFRLVQWNDAKY